jgi:3-deoxy-D-manno-octulosonate 8-phosphate phosphatase KdsC-like HAD superfamily phosphatase
MSVDHGDLSYNILSNSTYKELLNLNKTEYHILKESIRYHTKPYIGDDINDIELLKAVKHKACPANAVKQVKSIKGIKRLKNKGGNGAVREFIEHLLN